MSNLDLLTKNEAVQAAAEGWLVSHVYDLKSKSWRVMILPYGERFKKDAKKASYWVMGRAQQSSALHLKALRLAVHGPQ